MLRRRILGLAAMLLVAVSASAWALPQSNPEAQRAIAELPALVQPLASLPMDKPLPKSDAGTKVGLEVCVITVNTTKAACDFFPEGKGRCLVGGRLLKNDRNQFFERLKKTEGVEIAEMWFSPMDEPVSLIDGRGPPPTGFFSGRFAKASYSPWVIVATATPSARKDGTVVVDFAVQLMRPKRGSTTVYVNSVLDEITSASGKIRLQASRNDSLVVGGLKQIWTDSRTAPRPILGRLPLIGASFTYQIDDVNDEEAIVVVTPRPVAPMSSACEMNRTMLGAPMPSSAVK